MSRQWSRSCAVPGLLCPRWRFTGLRRLLDYFKRSESRSITDRSPADLTALCEDPALHWEDSITCTPSADQTRDSCICLHSTVLWTL